MNGKNIIGTLAIVIAAGILTAGCDDGTSEFQQNQLNTDTYDQPDAAEPSAGDQFGTAYLAIQVDTKQSQCIDPAIFLVTMTSEEGESITCEADFSDESMSGPWVDGSEDDGSGHAWADCFQAGIPPGTYLISIDILDADGNPVDCCYVDPESFNPVILVNGGHTTEVSVKVVCATPEDGATDFFVWVNHPPVIDEVDFDKYKFEAICNLVTAALLASDQDADELTYEFGVTSAPDGAVYQLQWTPDSPMFAFVAATPGDYLILVTVTDEHGESSSLEFPIHIVSLSGDTGDCAQYFNS